MQHWMFICRVHNKQEASSELLSLLSTLLFKHNNTVPESFVNQELTHVNPLFALVANENIFTCVI